MFVFTVCIRKMFLFLNRIKAKNNAYFWKCVIHQKLMPFTLLQWKQIFPPIFKSFFKKQSCESENLWPLAIEVINKSMPSENCEKNNKDNEDWISTKYSGSLFGGFSQPWGIFFNCCRDAFASQNSSNRRIRPVCMG